MSYANKLGILPSIGSQMLNLLTVFSIIIESGITSEAVYFILLSIVSALSVLSIWCDHLDDQLHATSTCISAQGVE